MRKIPRFQKRELLACAIGSVLTMILWAVPVSAQPGTGNFLTGAVHSASGKGMEGVSVSAKADGQSVTTTVFTDDSGNYYFPATLAAGQYRVWAQAEGYEYAEAQVNLAQSVTRQDFSLNPSAHVVRQMTGQEYITSLAENTPDQRRVKNIVYDTCTGCHEPNYILQNRFDEKGWESILNLMSRVENGSGIYGGPDQAPFPVMQYYKKDLAAYLAENRGPGKSAMKIQLHPRPTGDPARAVITEYDVPLADAQPSKTDNGYATNGGSDWSLGTPSALNRVRGIHDTQPDLNGNIWFTYAEPSYTRSLGMVNAKTGKVTSILIPGADGMAALTHGLAVDPKGILWFTVIGLSGEGSALGRIDPNTMKYELFPPAKGMPPIINGAVDFDVRGFIWVTSRRGVLRFNPETRRFDHDFRSPTFADNGIGVTYGIAVDRDGNAWWTQINIDRVDKADPNTGKVHAFKVPSRPSLAGAVFTKEDKQLYSLAGVELTDFSGLYSQGPRRMGADRRSDAVWVCNYWGGDVMKVDIHSMRTTFYRYPTPESAPYDAVVDNEHNVWVNLTNGDSVAKLDPSTGKWTEYPLPSRGIALRHIALSERNGVKQIYVGYTRNSRVARLSFRSEQDLQALAARVYGLEKKLSANARSGN